MINYGLFFSFLATAKGLSSSCSIRVVEHVFPDLSVATLILDVFQSSFLRFTIFAQWLLYALRVVVASSISSNDRNKGYRFWHSRWKYDSETCTKDRMYDH